MAFSIVEFVTRIAIGLLVGGIIGVPIVLSIWYFKLRKIRKSIPPDMENKIKEFKKNERRIEDGREEKEKLRKVRRNQRAVDAIESNTWNSVENIRRGKGTGESGKIQKTTPNTIKRTKSNSKGNWPSFE